MSNNNKTRIGTLTGVSIVVANMIGAGAFTSLGFQLESLSNTGVILSLWILGGIVALSGAFSYAEIGTMIKKSGGEYTFLSRIYHPIVGYLSGWISLTVGFAAPIALSVIAFTKYLPLDIEYPKLIGITLIFIITFIHCFNLKSSSKFQNISTLLKVLFIICIIVIGIILPESENSAINFEQPYWTEIGSLAFAVSLIYVSYSYSGWNAAAYITEEFRNPQRSLPRALIGGTLLVTILYTLLQFILLKHVPYSELVGKLNVGSIGFEYMLGSATAKIFSAGISILLISGISAMVWIGPRVTSNIAREHKLWSFFKAETNFIPKRALWLQFTLTVLLLLTGTFEQIMIYCGFLLNVSTLLVVIGVLILRLKKTNAYKSFRSPLFPLFQIIFIIVSLWTITFAFMHSPLECLLGFGNLLLGFLTYFISYKIDRSKSL